MLATSSIALRSGEITTADWDFFYRCYAHLPRPSLHRLLSHAGATSSARMAEDHAGELAAVHHGALASRSPPLPHLVQTITPAARAFGRYFGAVYLHVPLHAPTRVITNAAVGAGIQRLRGWRTGREHKMARGLMLVDLVGSTGSRTRSSRRPWATS